MQKKEIEKESWYICKEVKKQCKKIESSSLQRRGPASYKFRRLKPKILRKMFEFTSQTT